MGRGGISFNWRHVKRTLGGGGGGGGKEWVRCAQLEMTGTLHSVYCALVS